MLHRLRAAVTDAFPPVEVAHAHSGTHSYVFVVIDDHELHGTVQHPLADLARAIGIEVPEDDAQAERAIEDHGAAIVSCVSEHFSLAGSDGAWQLAYGAPRLLTHGHGAYGIVPFEVTVVVGDPGSFTVTSTGLAGQGHHHETLVIAKTFDGVGRFRTARSEQFEVDPHVGSVAVAIDPGSPVGALAGAAKGVGRGLRRRLPGS